MTGEAILYIFTAVISLPLLADYTEFENGYLRTVKKKKFKTTSAETLILRDSVCWKLVTLTS